MSFEEAAIQAADTSGDEQHQTTDADFCIQRDKRRSGCVGHINGTSCRLLGHSSMENRCGKTAQKPRDAQSVTSF